MFFNKFFTSIELNAQKPDIKFYQEILNKLNMSPNEVIMVGNYYIKDIKPAKAIGIGTILYSETKDNEAVPYADYTINSMSELYSAILNFKR